MSNKKKTLLDMMREKGFPLAAESSKPSEANAKEVRQKTSSALKPSSSQPLQPMQSITKKTDGGKTLLDLMKEQKFPLVTAVQEQGVQLQEGLEESEELDDKENSSVELTTEQLDQQINQEAAALLEDAKWVAERLKEGASNYNKLSPIEKDQYQESMKAIFTLFKEKSRLRPEEIVTQHAVSMVSINRSGEKPIQRLGELLKEFESAEFWENPTAEYVAKMRLAAAFLREGSESTEEEKSAMALPAMRVFENLRSSFNANPENIETRTDQYYEGIRSRSQHFSDKPPYEIFPNADLSDYKNILRSVSPYINNQFENQYGRLMDLYREAEQTGNSHIIVDSLADPSILTTDKDQWMMDFLSQHTVTLYNIHTLFYKKVNEISEAANRAKVILKARSSRILGGLDEISEIPSVLQGLEDDEIEVMVNESLDSMQSSAFVPTNIELITDQSYLRPLTLSLDAFHRLFKGPNGLPEVEQKIYRSIKQSMFSGEDGETNFSRMIADLKESPEIAHWESGKDLKSCLAHKAKLEIPSLEDAKILLLEEVQKLQPFVERYAGPIDEDLALFFHNTMLKNLNIFMLDDKNVALFLEKISPEFHNELVKIYQAVGFIAASAQNETSANGQYSEIKIELLQSPLVSAVTLDESGYLLDILSKGPNLNFYNLHHYLASICHIFQRALDQNLSFNEMDFFVEEELS